MVSVIPKHIAAFIIGTDHALYRKYKDDGDPDTKWTGWAHVGGAWLDDPVTVKRIDGEANIFMVDTTHSLQHSVFNFLLGHGLKPWKNLGGPILGPPAVANCKGTIHIFYLGLDHALYHGSWDGTNYAPFQSLGGVYLHTPTAVSVGENQVSVFAVGVTDGQLYNYDWTLSTGWSSPKALPGIWTGTPCAMSDQEGSCHVWGIDQNMTINHVFRQGNSDFGFETIDGVTLKTIDAVSWGPGRIDLVGLGMNSEIYHRAWNGNTWGVWESLEGSLSRRPTPVCHSPGALSVLAVGTNCIMYIKVRNPQTGVWGAWTDIQGVINSRVA